MDSKIKVAEFISRLEFGGAEAMLQPTFSIRSSLTFTLSRRTSTMTTASVNLKMQAIPFIL